MTLSTENTRGCHFVWHLICPALQISSRRFSAWFLVYHNNTTCLSAKQMILSKEEVVLSSSIRPQSGKRFLSKPKSKIGQSSPKASLFDSGSGSGDPSSSKASVTGSETVEISSASSPSGIVFGENPEALSTSLAFGADFEGKATASSSFDSGSDEEITPGWA